MGTVSGLFFISSAVVSVGLGWLSHELFNRLLDSRQVALPFDQDSRPLATGHSRTLDSTIDIQNTEYCLLQEAPIGYLEVDDENQLLWINPLACKMLGIPCTDTCELVSPRLLLELVRSYELDQLIETVRKNQTSRQLDWVLHLVSPDPINPNKGIACPLRGYGMPLANNYVGVFLENRQEAETLIQQRNRWTSDVAHELKTPLTSIRLVTETLRDRVDLASKQWLDRLLNEILRLSNLVEDLLNLSRLERKGGNGLTLKLVELPRLLFSAWQSLEPLADTKQIEIAYEGTPDLFVTLDETLMYRVFINLIDNAIKYSPHEGTIFVEAGFRQVDTMTAPGKQLIQSLVIDVIDEGSGFHESDLPYIFNRFYRADTSRSRPFSEIEAVRTPPEKHRGVARNSGTGLGLAIVQQIVEAHGGTTQAQNHPKTGGGWLTISIPMQSVARDEITLAQDKTSVST